MADEDIFGKIDAMLGRRAGFGGVRPAVDDDFPLLTEVVEEGPKGVVSQPADALATPPVAMPDQTTPAELSEMDIDRLAAALEARMSELFIRQQLRIESIVRRVIREELDDREQ